MIYNFSRALELATTGGHGGVAGAYIMVAGSAWRNTAAARTASPTCPLAHFLPRR